MWTPWKKQNNDYTTPKKPRNVNKQLSMVWDFCYNHLPSRLAEQDRKILWQDRKLNFVLIFLALLLAALGKLAFS